jgi:hypothetical protein
MQARLDAAAAEVGIPPGNLTFRRIDPTKVFYTEDQSGLRRVFDMDRPMTLFLTDEEKAWRVNDYHAQRNEWFDPTLVGTPDREVYGLCDSINALPGICTLQSCAGHHGVEKKAEGQPRMPGHLWLRLSKDVFRRFLDECEELAHDPLIEQISVLYGREPTGHVVEILFHGNDEGVLPASEKLLVGFFTRLAQPPSDANRPFVF